MVCEFTLQSGKHTKLKYFVASSQKSLVLNMSSFAPAGLNSSVALLGSVSSAMRAEIVSARPAEVARSPPLKTLPSHLSQGVRQQSQRYLSRSAWSSSSGGEPPTPSTKTVLAADEQTVCLIITSTTEVRFMV